MTIRATTDIASLLPGAACHSLAIRLDHGFDSERARERLAEADMQTVYGGAKLWTTRVHARAAAPEAQRRRAAEATRPIRAGVAPLRAVLLHYDDGQDLILVADRSRIPLPSLRQAATLLTSENPTSGAALACGILQEPAPDTGRRDALRPAWGLPDHHDVSLTGWTSLKLALESGIDRTSLTGATALTVARYSGDEAVRLGTLDPAEHLEPRVITLKTHEGQDVSELLARAGVRPGERTDHEPLPSVGIIHTKEGQEEYEPSLAPVFPLTLRVTERADGTLDATCRFEEAAVSRTIAEQFCSYLVRVAADLGVRTGPRLLTDVAPLTGETARDILALGGLGTMAPSSGSSGGAIHQRFAKIAGMSPHATCLTAGSTQLTYQELNIRAEICAAGLRDVGVAPGDLVGVCLERDADLIVVLLAVLKAGAAYVPMDTRHPVDRLRYTAADAGLRVVVTTLDTFPAPDGAVVVSPAEVTQRGTASPSPEPEHSADSGASTAYVIYTSGSTGRPKGVVVPHRNVIALVEATTADFRLGPDDTWTLFHSSAFDFSVWEMWGCLLTGGRLVVVPYWVTRDTDEFCELVLTERVTVLNQTPSAFSQLLNAGQLHERESALRLIIFGGEPLDTRMLETWYARRSPASCRLVNMFGITETTVHVTSHTVTPKDVASGSRSVGKPLPGWHLSVRDRHGRLLPPGATGELCVGGAGVADRYLGKPDLTAERFVHDPLTGELVYRSGDQGRMWPDGTFDHLGRSDNQVKLRGYRIELDEIRAALIDCGGISAAAVTVRQDDPANPASRRLDGYVAAADDTLDLDAVQARLRAVLPDYMVPSTLTILTEIPLTINGKLDKTRLPDPRTAATRFPAVSAEVAPQTSRVALADPAATIVRIWSAILKTEVGLDDNFFRLGGNSLMVVQAIAALRTEGLPKVSSTEFYKNSTARQLISLVQQLTEASP
ncbi:amino acid adenylation domain-containing protein [Streptomyces sp. MC1]|uniref:amino acid adenylation domain-containing protein n=1 Tax=Streptomyces sp. MC1 TaxID=295105 RepID=UPI0018CAB79E|nr:amino acid adenylation domain-containing protein [Streptomyces sp. MC1]MBG7696639.1 amino acid adenylation domain-containing protein [Streptomyces sp. MC1]